MSDNDPSKNAGVVRFGDRPDDPHITRSKSRAPLIIGLVVATILVGALMAWALGLTQLGKTDNLDNESIEIADAPPASDAGADQSEEAAANDPDPGAEIDAGSNLSMSTDGVELDARRATTELDRRKNAWDSDPVARRRPGEARLQARETRGSDGGPLVDADGNPVVSHIARPYGDVRALFSGDDYPDAARDANATGTTQVRLRIGPNGRPYTCEIVRSAGHVALDRATCAVLMRRARFRPALDQNGNPIDDIYTTPPIRWSLAG